MMAATAGLLTIRGSVQLAAGTADSGIAIEMARKGSNKGRRASTDNNISSSSNSSSSITVTGSRISAAGDATGATETSRRRADLSGR